MKTLFSHIIQKFYSKSFEDIATETLAYILNTHDTTHQAMMRFLRTIEPTLPDLDFNTQMVEGSIRPDMWGYSGNNTYLYVEDKFWAGLTENQPVNYLEELSKYDNPTLLLMVVPGAREQTMVIELLRRITEAGIEFTEVDANHEEIVWQVKTEIGPTLTLTSWPRLLEIFKKSAEGKTAAKADIKLLQSLCDAADIDKFTPFDASDLNNQLTPAFILQLGQVIRDAGAIGERKGFLIKGRMTTGVTFSGFGSYYWLNKENSVGVWLGVDYELWKTYGVSPLWLRFSNTQDFGRASEIEPVLRALPEINCCIRKPDNGYLVIPITLKAGCEKDMVINDVAKQLENIADALANVSVIES